MGRSREGSIISRETNCGLAAPGPDCSGAAYCNTASEDGEGAGIGVAQQSPQALEKLKEAGKEMKLHFQRLLDPVAKRRSPEFNRVAQRYKGELRALIDEQQRVILQARQATRRVNQLLGERDEALSRLDPGYVAKRKSAAAALAQYGIDLGGEDAAALEDTVSREALEDLDF